ncbi:unnamed protein product [Parnassius apollo]|uniref:(apollo) hypothetical protein n=1 Tax=Parnassius apollo TaxID=110799 RepID=A0A8S3X097_PARAO|nr:unnamed protein product [Parnassius apollo]
MDDGIKWNAQRAAAWRSPGRVWSWRWMRQHANRQPSARCCTTTQQLLASIIPTSWLGVTEQNLADRVRYILRSNTFDVTELERLRREAVSSSGENAAAEDAAPQLAEQTANVDAAVNTPVVVDSNDDGTVTQELELEQMRSTLEEAIVETRSTTLENRPRLPR